MFSKKLTPGEKAALTRKRHEEEAERKKQEAAAKRAATIEAKRKAAEKKVAKKERRKKFMEFSSKPIVWVFAIIGWLSTVYFFIKFVVLILLKVFGIEIEVL